MLRFSKLWIALSALLLVASLWIALKPITLEDESWLGWISFLTRSDKVIHVEAFLGLGAWFGSLAGPARWRSVGVMLILYGALVEILQGLLTADRHPDIYDLVADVAGIALGLLAARWFGRNWLLRVDGWLAARAG